MFSTIVGDNGSGHGDHARVHGDCGVAHDEYNNSRSISNSEASPVNNNLKKKGSKNSGEAEMVRHNATTATFDGKSTSAVQGLVNKVAVDGSQCSTSKIEVNNGNQTRPAQVVKKITADSSM